MCLCFSFFFAFVLHFYYLLLLSYLWCCFRFFFLISFYLVSKFVAYTIRYFTLFLLSSFSHLFLLLYTFTNNILSIFLFLLSFTILLYLNFLNSYNSAIVFFFSIYFCGNSYTDVPHPEQFANGFPKT